MTTNKQKNSNEILVASSTDAIHKKTRPYRVLLPDIDHLSIPNEEDEADLAETIDYTSRPWSNLSVTTVPMKKFSSRLYKFVQLEQAFKSANLLTNPNDQAKFADEYRESLRENKFEEFLQTSYHKLQVHKETIRREHTVKLSRTFTFVDLEKNFLALDPTRDIKIVFIDEPTTSSTSEMKYVKQIFCRFLQWRIEGGGKCKGERTTAHFIWRFVH